MKRMIMIAGMAAALCAGGWMGVESHQPEGMEGGMPDMEQMLAMMNQMSKPDTAHHTMLEKFAGVWDMKASFKMDPTAPPDISTGTARGTWLLGKRQLMSEVEMDMMFMGKQQDFSGIGIMGYDKGTGEFVSTWMDTMGTGQMRQTGTMMGDTIVMVGSAKHPMMGEYTLKNVYTFVDGGYDMEFWEKGEMIGPEFVNTGVIEYRRPQ